MAVVGDPHHFQSLKMFSTQIIEMSLADSGPSHDFTHPTNGFHDGTCTCMQHDRSHCFCNTALAYMQ